MKSKFGITVAFLGASGLALGSQGDAPLSIKLARLAKTLGTRAGDVRAQENFPLLTVANASGAVVGAMIADDFGDGVLAIANRVGAAQPSAIRVVLDVSETDSGRITVMNQSGVPRFLLDGNGGLYSANGDM